MPEIDRELVRIRLFGGLRAELLEPPRVISRFRSRNIAALLAFLALHRGNPPTREQLADLLWPDADLDAARNNLRVALYSLRRQLEPPGVPAGSVLRTVGKDRIGLNPQTTWVDVAAFEDLIRQSRREGLSPRQQCLLLEEAVQLSSTPLLSGDYHDWIEPRRRSLEGQAEAAKDRLDVLRPETGTSGAELLRSGERPFENFDAERHPEARRPVAVESRSPLRRISHLPVFLTRFFGREAEVETLFSLLQPRLVSQNAAVPDGTATRLVTLTGPGGSGKTRLAVEVVQRFAATSVFPDGIVWANVMDARHPAGLAEAILEATRAADKPHVPGPGNDNSLDRVVQALDGDRACLLVLDNFEQVVEAGGPEFVQHLLGRAPHVSCLVTSRQCLQLGAEREFPVRALPTPAALPPSAPAVLPETLMGFASVQLFVDRAQAARPDFQITLRNATAIGTLCAELEGLPLALELAAGWSLTLTPEQMVERLARREVAPLLTTRRRDVPARHQSLPAILEESFGLLPPSLQRLLARLSVFRGSFTTEAATSIASENLSSAAVLAGLRELRERSLLLTEERGGSVRWRLLLLIRSFAEEQLRDCEREEIEQRHALYYQRLAEQAEPHLRGGAEQAAWIEALDDDLDNIRAVLRRFSGGQRHWPPELALRLLGALGWFWVVRSHWREGLQWLRQILAEKGNEGNARLEASSVAPIRARALCAAALLASALNLFEECMGYCLQCLERGDAGDGWEAAFSTAMLGAVTCRQGEYEPGSDLLEAGLFRFRQIDDAWGAAFALDNLAHACRDQQQYERAARLYDESRSLREAMDDRQGIAMSLSNLADTAQLSGQWERATVLHEASLDRFRQLGDQAGIGYCLRRLGECALEQGDHGRADILHRESLLLFRDLGDRRRIAESLEKTAFLRVAQGRETTAARLLGAASALRHRIGMPVPPSEMQRLEDALAALRQCAGPAAVDRAWLQGQTLDREAIFACALEEDT